MGMKKKVKKIAKDTAKVAKKATKVAIKANPVSVPIKAAEKAKSIKNDKNRERKEKTINYESDSGMNLKKLASLLSVTNRVVNNIAEERFDNVIISDYSLDDYIKENKIIPKSVIVCETNEKMKPHKVSHGIHKKIHEMAGTGLDKECEGLLPCYIGETIVTNSYDLYKYNIEKIIHFISPQYDKELTRGTALEYIRKACEKSLSKARERGYKCVIFPTFHISDKYTKGKNVRSIADTVMSSIHDWFYNNDYDMQIIICTEDKSEKYNISKENARATNINKNSLALVLQGGGARGAFQIGVWDILHKEKIADKITGFSGTSIGAIDTMLCMAPVDMKEKFKVWEEYTQEDLTDDKNQKKLRSKIVNFMNILGEDKIIHLKYKYDIYSTVCERGGGERYINWKRLSYDSIIDLICSSANHPGLYIKKLLSKKLDGGTKSKIIEEVGKRTDFFEPDLDRDNTNVPIQPLYDIGYRNFIIVYLKPRNIDQERAEKLRYGDARFFRIYPQKSLGNMRKIIDEKNNISTLDRIELGKEAAIDFLNS